MDGCAGSLGTLRICTCTGGDHYLFKRSRVGIKTENCTESEVSSKHPFGRSQLLYRVEILSLLENDEIISTGGDV